MSHHRFTFTMDQTPVAAVDLLQSRRAQRIFNAYQFGGYLISRDIPVFINGRAEFYGETFAMDVFSRGAQEARQPDAAAVRGPQGDSDRWLRGSRPPSGGQQPLTARPQGRQGSRSDRAAAPQVHKSRGKKS